MGITLVSDSATIGTTEYFLASDSTSKTDQTDDVMLQAWIDWGNLASGDQYEWKVYEKINAGTQRVVAHGVVTGVQSNPTVTPALVVGDGWEVSVKKLAGADRVIGWSLRKVT